MDDNEPEDDEPEDDEPEDNEPEDDEPEHMTTDRDVARDTFPALAESVRERLMIVQDSTSECPYIDGQTARMPLYYPTPPRRPEDVDVLLEGGFRRSSQFVYHTRCPACDACQPTRVRAKDFVWSKSFRRVLKRAEGAVECRWQRPVVDAKRVQLYNDHRNTRGLAGDADVDAEDYQAFLTTTCWPTLELEMRLDEELVGVSIMDVGRDSVSAVYTHFDPSASRFSLGTLAVLQQIRWAIDHQRTWVYLGLYVAENSHLNYKSRYLPQERLIDGCWTDAT